MKKIAFLMLLLVLGACGSSGTMLTVRDSNFLLTSNVDNDSRRHAHILETLGADYNSSVNSVSDPLQRGGAGKNSNICKSERDCDDMAFESMKAYLLDSDFSDWSNVSALRDALILAGFKDSLPGNMDDIKQWAREHQEEIQSQAQDIYDEFGIRYSFDISKSDFSVVDDSEHPTKIRFVLDPNTGEVKNINMIERFGMPDEMVWNGKRHDQTTKFTIESPIYEYAINGVGDDYDGPGYQTFRFKANHDMSLAEIKEMFKILAKQELEAGSDGFFGGFHANDATPQIVYDSFIKQLDSIKSKSDLEILTRYEIHNYDINAYGKTVGLAYSDFGFLDTSDIGAQHEIEKTLYHGGYHDHKISDVVLAELRNDAETNISFTGRSVGRVNFNTTKNFSNGGRIVNKEVKIEGNAKLYFIGGLDGGKTTLKMEFPEWYDVYVVNNTSGNSITFDNFTGKDSDLQFHLSGDQEIARSEYTVENFDGQKTIDTNNDSMTGSSFGADTIQFFGHTTESIPTEVSGFITYSETEPDASGMTVRQIQFESAFGAIREY